MQFTAVSLRKRQHNAVTGYGKPNNDHERDAVTKPQYKTKVKTQTLDIAQPETKPQQVTEDVWEVDTKKGGLSLGAAKLGFGVVSLIGFFVFEAYTTLAATFPSTPSVQVY